MFGFQMMVLFFISATYWPMMMAEKYRSFIDIICAAAMVALAIHMIFKSPGSKIVAPLGVFDAGDFALLFPICLSVAHALLLDAPILFTVIAAGLLYYALEIRRRISERNNNIHLHR